MEINLVKIEKIEPHSNADRLEIAYVDGMPGIVQKGDFVEGEESICIPFDFIVPSTEDFDEPFRGKRVRPIKLRGEFSMCLILKNKWGFTESDNIQEKLGITKWEPPLILEKGMNAPKTYVDNPPPGVIVHKYDIDSILKYKNNIEIGEEVIITEKIEGENSRHVFSNGRLYVGSRNRWIKEKEENNSWHWDIANNHGLKEELSKYPGLVLFGEAHGIVGGFDYYSQPNEVLFRAFDIWDSTKMRFLDYEDFVKVCQDIDVLMAPVLYHGPWLGLDQHSHLAEGQSSIAKHIREGFVVRLAKERQARSGRIHYKLHGKDYLIRKGKLK